MGGCLIDHPQALRSLEMLVRALWDTHDFTVDGRIVTDRNEVMQGFREDRMVSFSPRETFK